MKAEKEEGKGRGVTATEYAIGAREENKKERGKRPLYLMEEEARSSSSSQPRHDISPGSISSVTPTQPRAAASV